MICAACGTENRPGRKFCSECGAPLAVLCPRCQAPNQPGEKFCGECATSLVGGSAPQPAGRAPTDRVTPVIERRLVSVLFADLVGFTTVAESRDPETVRELLNRYFELARQIIERYGGTLEKFIGDAVMAVWGAPVAQEDDAERAVRAALDLVDGVAALGAEAGIDGLQLRAGVMTGEAAVTVGAVGQGLVAGDLVNTASRLQSVAAPGSVLVGEATHRSTSSAIAFEKAGDQTLKGKVLPVEAWRAVRVVAARGGQGRSERLEAPFVGRTEEFRLLKELFHATEREGRMRLLSVTGIGGIGKSRLAWEFQKYIDGVAGDVYWHGGRSPAYGEGITFWALGEMVRGRAEIAEGEDPRAARDKLGAMLTEWLPDDDERRWVEPRLATLLGLETNAATVDQQELFAAWRVLFERISERGPTVLVFEELQWADAGLLDFIESMLEWSRSRPILIITLARPELLEKRPTWGAGQRSFVALHLDPLPDDAMAELLAGLAPGLPDGLVRQIVQRAEGTPLYAVETVRMLVDEGRLVRAGDSYELAGELESLGIPPTLQSLITARVDALPPELRALLQTASVLGQSFTVDGLAAITGDGPGSLEPRLRELVRRELLALEADHRSPERGQFHFVQAMIREVVYGTLSRADRRARHVAAARHFEALGDDELAGVLANHYLAAYRTDPHGAEGAALAAQAHVALRAAAERAQALGSHAQALSYLRQALDVTTDERERAEVLFRAGVAAAQAHLVPDADAHLRAAIDAYRQLGDPNRAARGTVVLGHVLMVQSRNEDARATLEEALGELTGSGSAADPEIVELMGQLARAAMFRNRQEEALGWIERALPMSEALNLPQSTAELLVTKGWALDASRRPREAVAVLHGAVALADAIGYVPARLRGRVNLSGLLISEDPHRSLAIAREGIELATRHGLLRAFGLLPGNAGQAAFLCGEWDWIEAVSAEYEVDERSDFISLGLALSVAQLKAFRGDTEGARRALGALESLAQRSDSHQDTAEVHATTAIVALGAGDLEAAYRDGSTAAREGAGETPTGALAAVRAAAWLRDAGHLEELIRIIDEPRVHGSVYRALRTEAEAALAGAAGDSARSAKLFVQATDAWRALRLTAPTAMCQISQVTVLGADHPASPAAAHEARQTFERLGSPPMLARLDNLGAGDAPQPMAEVAS